jgi:tetratricopeptide (TPR) repeat protein
MEACKHLGHVLSFQGKAAEALENYQQELSLAQKAGADHKDELAEALVNVGDAKRDLHDPNDAVEHYEKAESIYRQITKTTASQSVEKKNLYAFWSLLRSHAELLRQMGQPDAAASLEHEAAGITVEEGVHPQKPGGR